MKKAEREVESTSLPIFGVDTEFVEALKHLYKLVLQHHAEEVPMSDVYEAAFAARKIQRRKRKQ